MGGLLRRATFLKQYSAKNSILYFDLGNNFPEPSEQGNLKVELIQQSLKIFYPAVVMVGPNEWHYGPESLDAELPYLLSNASANLPYLKSYETTQDDRKVSVLGYLSPKFAYQNPNDPPSVIPLNTELLAEWEEHLKKKSGDLNLLLFRGTIDELEAFQRSGIFDLIVAGSSNDDELQQQMEVETSLGEVPMIPTKGQGVVAGKWNAAGKMEAMGELEIPGGLGVSWLRRETPDDPRLLPLFKDYDTRVKELFFTNLDRMENQLRDSPFFGNSACSVCHSEAMKVWKSTKHSHAFATLQQVGKHFDPECLECHVVGLKPWEPPAGSDVAMRKWAGEQGFLSPQLTPHLMNVQCENCHGPARAHMINPKVRLPIAKPSEGCITCHHGSHSPLFNYENYWPKIEHK